MCESQEALRLKKRSVALLRGELVRMSESALCAGVLPREAAARLAVIKNMIVYLRG